MSRARVRAGRPALGGQRVEQAAREIHALLLKKRASVGPRVGVDLPMDDSQLALVAQKAVDLFPDLTVIKGAERMMICFRGPFEASSEELQKSLGDEGFVGRDVASDILAADGKDPDVA